MNVIAALLLRLPFKFAVPLNVIAALLLRLSWKCVVVSVFVVRVPVTRLFPAIVISASAPNTRDGVADDVIPLARVRLPDKLRTNAELFQLTLDVGSNVKDVAVPVVLILKTAPPVLVTYILGL